MQLRSGDLGPFILHQRQKSWKAPVLPWQALLTLESWPLVCNKTQHVAAKAECVCAEGLHCHYSLMSPSWGTRGRTGKECVVPVRYKPQELWRGSQLRGHRKPWIGGKLVKRSRKDVCTWEAKKPTWRGDLWEVGMWPPIDGLGGCTFCPILREAVATGALRCYHSNCSSSPNCSGDLSCQVYKRWHLITKDRWKYFL